MISAGRQGVAAWMSFVSDSAAATVFPIARQKS
jgi:hypothetical protein